MVIARTLLHVEAADHRLMRRVHRWMPPPWVRWWMLAATRAGDGWLWYLCGVVVLLSGDVNGHRAVGAAALAVGSGIGLFKCLKRCVGRTRPCALERHCWADLLPPDRFSFPSGHTITAFAVTAALGGFYPAALPALLFCAVSVAASRIVLGMHFLSDVMAGAALGCILGYTSVRLFA